MYPAKRFLHPEEAADFVGGPSIFNAFLKDGWIAPVIKGKRLTVYDIKRLDAACDRFALGQLPPSLSKDRQAA